MFSLYSHKSTEKTFYRLLKILKEFHFQKSDDVIEKSGSKHLKGYEPPSTLISTSGLTIQPLFCHDDDADEKSEESENHEVDFKEGFCVESIYQNTNFEANDYEVDYNKTKENTIYVKDMTAYPKEQIETPIHYADENENKFSLPTSEVCKSSYISLNTIVDTPSKKQEIRHNEYKPKLPTHSDQTMACTNYRTSTKNVVELYPEGTSFLDIVNSKYANNPLTRDSHDTAGYFAPGSSMQATNSEIFIIIRTVPTFQI